MLPILVKPGYKGLNRFCSLIFAQGNFFSDAKGGRMPQKQHLFLEILALLFVLNGCIAVPEADKQNNTFIIAPGKGIREMTIGESPSGTLEVMGEPEHRTTYEEEYEAYAGSGFNPDTQLEFTLGFDVCFEYSMEQNRSMYPIYKIFFKQHKIRIMMFSAFLYTAEFLQNIFIASEELKFYSQTGDMERVLGTNYAYHPLAIYSYDQGTGSFVPVENYAIYDYLEQGISVIVEHDEIVSVQIYAPVSPDLKTQYTDQILNIPHRRSN